MKIDDNKNDEVRNTKYEIQDEHMRKEEQNFPVKTRARRFLNDCKNNNKMTEITFTSTIKYIITTTLPYQILD